MWPGPSDVYDACQKKEATSMMVYYYILYRLVGERREKLTGIFHLINIFDNHEFIMW